MDFFDMYNKGKKASQPTMLQNFGKIPGKRGQSQSATNKKSTRPDL